MSSLIAYSQMKVGLIKVVQLNECYKNSLTNPITYRIAPNFCNFRNYAIITKIIFTKFSSQLIILDTIGTR